MTDLPENVRLSPDGTGVIILDQTQLPARRVFLTLTTAGEMYEAIQDVYKRQFLHLPLRGKDGLAGCQLHVRGFPAHTHREIRRTGTSLGKFGQIGLHDPVLQRVEGDHGQPSPPVEAGNRGTCLLYTSRCV